jgi:hypothetical protein
MWRNWEAEITASTERKSLTYRTDETYMLAVIYFGSLVKDSMLKK